jgi:hypothetical protein
MSMLLELLLAPLLVGAATLAAQRWGERTGGILSAFPAIVGPLLLVSFSEHGAEFARRVADGTLLGLAGLSAFTVAYALTARRRSWLWSLLCGWVAAAGADALVELLFSSRRPGLDCAVAVASVLAANAWLRRLIEARDAGSLCATAFVERSASAVLSRMAAAAVLVVALSGAAGALGAGVGGLLASLPVLASVLAVFTHRDEGSPRLVGLLGGMLSGMAGFIAFCAAVAALIVPLGAVAAFSLGALLAAGLQLAAGGGLLSARRWRRASAPARAGR